MKGSYVTVKNRLLCWDNEWYLTSGSHLLRSSVRSLPSLMLCAYQQQFLSVLSIPSRYWQPTSAWDISPERCSQCNSEASADRLYPTRRWRSDMRKGANDKPLIQYVQTAFLPSYSPGYFTSNGFMRRITELLFNMTLAWGFEMLLQCCPVVFPSCSSTRIKPQHLDGLIAFMVTYLLCWIHWIIGQKFE